MFGLHRPRFAWVVALVLAPACDDPQEEAKVTDPTETGDQGDTSDWHSLIDHAAWTSTPQAADPLASHRPGEVSCEGGYVREDTSLEIDTGACNYLSLTQPLPASIEAGDVLRVIAWWQRLASETPAVGHFALLIGADVIWQEDIAIPGPADARELEIVAPRAFDAGEPITLHLHNHGYNTWQFADLAVQRPHAH